MRHTRRERRVKRVDIYGDVDGCRNIEPEILAAATSLYDLDTETLELVAMVIVDRAKSHLNQTIGEPLLHDPGEGRGV